MPIANADAEPNAEPIAVPKPVPIDNAYGFTNANAVPIAHNGLLFACGHE